MVTAQHVECQITGCQGLLGKLTGVVMVAWDKRESLGHTALLDEPEWSAASRVRTSVGAK